MANVRFGSKAVIGPLIGALQGAGHMEPNIKMVIRPFRDICNGRFEGRVHVGWDNWRFEKYFVLYVAGKHGSNPMNLNGNRTTLFLRAAAILALICPGEILAQTAQGPSNTGTRQPMNCQPARSQPNNAAQIARMIQCARETNRSGTITTLNNISVEFGGTRKYQSFADGGNNGIDTTAPVMPLRGSLDRYICNPITHKIPGNVYSVDNTGKNCTVVHERKATGSCIRTTFGDWTCTMMEAVHPDEWVSNQSPPR